MAFIVIPICVEFDITAVLELVMTELDCASTSRSYLYVSIPWTVVYRLSIAS